MRGSGASDVRGGTDTASRGGERAMIGISCSISSPTGKQSEALLMQTMSVANQRMGKSRCLLCPREKIVDIDHAVLCSHELESITGRKPCATQLSVGSSLK